jgi:hypothetical protein
MDCIEYEFQLAIPFAGHERCGPKSGTGFSKPNFEDKDNWLMSDFAKYYQARFNILFDSTMTFCCESL